MSNTKLEARKTRAVRTRHAIRASGRQYRLCVHRTNKHIYAQIIENSKIDKVITSASSTDKDLRKSVTTGSNKDAAAVVGAEVAKKAVSLGIKAVAFDRSGNRYHGRVKALADAARENGLEF